MARGNEVRARMIDAGQDLLSSRGYGMTMLDVIEKAQAPRGSIYYHFPDGKEELAVEVARKTAAEITGLVAARSRRHPGTVEFLQALVDHHARRVVGSRFTEGCPLVGITTSAEGDSPQLAAAVRDGFDDWVNAIAAALAERGIPGEPGSQLATTVVAGIEGAIVLSRAARTRAPLDRFRASIPALVRGATTP